MSEMPEVEMLAYHVFDPAYAEDNPDKRRFYSEIRRRVDEIISEYGSPEDIEKLPTKEWTELRGRLLNLKLTLTADGEVI